MAALAVVAAPASARAGFQEDEARNYSKIGERYQHESGTPEYRRLLAERGAKSERERLEIATNDPERNPDNLCASHMDGCAGDVRLYDWADAGFGLSHPVLWTARNGATISGHVWATNNGPAKRPGIVLTTGSVQAPEELYLFAATTLAKRGYVVLTWDVQGQGRSDTFGEGVDRNEGVPSQAGQPFFDGSEDALDFFVSTPANRYKPRPSRSTATDHSPKQDRRVREGRNTAHNPFHDLLDPTRIGIVGHSLGAGAVSEVGQEDPRVDAIVAWDNLRTPSGFPTGSPAPALTKPALGLSADYGLTPMPYTAPPPPEARNGASKDLTAAGVDTGQLNIRGGTHYEFSYIPDPAFGATLRGMDMVAWYTAAWFDKYVKGDPTADRRLLTRRWLDDPREASVDPVRNGNLFSSYLRSRLDIGRGGGPRVACEDVGKGECGATTADDGEAPSYSYLREARTLDGGAPPVGAIVPDRATGERPSITASPGPQPGTAASGRRLFSAPSRLSLRRSRRTVRISLNLLEPTTVLATVRDRRRRIAGSTRVRLRPGARTFAIRLRRGTTPDAYELKFRLQSPTGSIIVRRPLTLTR